MDEDRVGITDMQCHVLRMAEKKWGITAKACSDIFRKYNILRFIEDCYDSLHLNSYQCALDDVETLLHNHGVAL